MPSHSISLVERRVLLGARFAARDSISTIAKRTGVRSHIVQRALKSLRERRILTPYMAVDVSKLGFTDYAVFFSVSPESAKLHKKLVQFLLNSVEVPWVVELVGEYQYAYSLICRHISEVDQFFLSLGRAVGVEMTTRTVVARTSWTIFPPRYLLQGSTITKPGYEILSQAEIAKYDELDLRVLRQLSRPHGPSDTECARALGEAATTIRSRRSALEQKGVIVSYAYSIDPVEIGRFPYVFLIQAKNPYNDLRRRLQAFAASEPEVTALLSCIGAWDYEIGLDAESPSSAAEFQRRLLDRFSKELVTIRSIAPLQTHKLEPFPSSIV